VKFATGGLQLSRCAAEFSSAVLNDTLYIGAKIKFYACFLQFWCYLGRILYSFTYINPYWVTLNSAKVGPVRRHTSLTGINKFLSIISTTRGRYRNKRSTQHRSTFVCFAEIGTGKTVICLRESIKMHLAQVSQRRTTFWKQVTSTWTVYDVTEFRMRHLVASQNKMVPVAPTVVRYFNEIYFTVRPTTFGAPFHSQLPYSLCLHSLNFISLSSF